MSGIVADATILVGQPTTLEGPSPTPPYGAVFEDDGRTAYFYGLDFSRREQPIADARHIYNVAQVVDRSTPSTVQIAWSTDGRKTVLLINKYPHAIIDFEERRSYCRTGFPPVDPDWSASGAEWDDRATDLFR